MRMNPTRESADRGPLQAAQPLAQEAHARSSSQNGIVKVRTAVLPAPP